MSDITVERRLQLVQQIRSQHNRNRYDLLNREKILYGRVSQPDYIADGEYTSAGAETQEPAFGSLKVRLLVSLALLVLVIVMDLGGKTIFGFTTGQIFECISWDLEIEDLGAETVTQF